MKKYWNIATGLSVVLLIAICSSKSANSLTINHLNTSSSTTENNTQTSKFALNKSLIRGCWVQTIKVPNSSTVMFDFHIFERNNKYYGSRIFTGFGKEFKYTGNWSINNQNIIKVNDNKRPTMSFSLISKSELKLFGSKNTAKKC